MHRAAEDLLAPLVLDEIDETAQPAFSTFATVESVTVSTSSGLATTHDVDLPATVDAGDLVIMITAADGQRGPGSPSGWTLLGSSTGAGSGWGRIFYISAVGDEDGTSVTLDYTQNSAGVSAHVYRITGWNAVEITSVVEKLDHTAPNPGEGTPSWGASDTL